MKIIVTGGAGFIGGNFVHHMVNKYPEYQIMEAVIEKEALPGNGKVCRILPAGLGEKIGDIAALSVAMHTK